MISPWQCAKGAGTVIELNQKSGLMPTKQSKEKSKRFHISFGEQHTVERENYQIVHAHSAPHRFTLRTHRYERIYNRFSSFSCFVRNQCYFAVENYYFVLISVRRFVPVSSLPLIAPYRPHIGNRFNC